MRFAAPGPKARQPLRAVLYHHIASTASSLVERLAVSTTPTVFEAHIRKLARDYEIVSLDTVLSGRLPRRALLLTFDDGYRSFLDSALPVLRLLGLPCLLFVTGACLEPYDSRSTTSSRTSAPPSESSASQWRSTLTRAAPHLLAAPRPGRRDALRPLRGGGRRTGGTV